MDAPMKDEKTIDDKCKNMIIRTAVVHDEIQYNEAERKVEQRKDQVSPLLYHVFQHNKEFPFFSSDGVHLVKNKQRDVKYKQIVLKHILLHWPGNQFYISGECDIAFTFIFWTQRPQCASDITIMLLVRSDRLFHGTQFN
jgi:hypothetical protein